MAAVPYDATAFWAHMAGATKQLPFHLRAHVKRTHDAGDSVRVWGWAAMSVDDIGNPVVDVDGDHVPIDVLERAVHEAFIRRGGQGAVGLLHESQNRADLVESFVLTAEKRDAFGLGQGPQGWIVGLISHDPEVIALVRSGYLMELSFRGKSLSRTVAYNPGREREMVKRCDDAEKSDSDNQQVLYADVADYLTLNDAELLSFVDVGASRNKRVRSRIVLVKRDPQARSKMPEKLHAKRTPQMILADLFEQGKLAELAPEEKEALLGALSSMPPPPPAPVEEPKADEGVLPDEQTKVDDMKPKQDEEEMAKRDRREKELAKQNRELTERVVQLEKRLGRGELVEMVKRDMAYFPGASVDELANVIEDARENLGSEKAAKLEEMLKGASEAARDSDLFKTAGVRRSGGGSSGNAEGQLLDLAKRMRTDNPKLSRHEAILAAGRERPDLWAKRAAGA